MTPRTVSLAACLAACAACSSAAAPSTASPGDAGSDSSSADASASHPDADADAALDGTSATSACEAGAPANPYATAQPFECDESLQTIPTRPSVTLPFDLVEPTSGPPAAVVVLLPGGDGVLHLSAQGIGASADNFVVRTRQQYAAAGLVAAIPDVPSDRPQGLDDFRATQAHADDLAALVQHLRGAYPALHVWLVSTSRGTISAANALARYAPPQGPDRIVLTSSVTRIPPDAGDPEDIQSVPDYVAKLSAAVPILMIDEASDACGASPPLTGPGGAGAQALAKTLGDDPHFVLVDGGATPPDGADPCGGLSYHGFYGEDAAVVARIVAFIQAHP